MTTSLEVDAVDAAAERIRKELKFPEQLAKVNSLRESILRKKAGVDSQLKALVETQLNAERDGLTHLKESVDLMESIRGEFENVDGWCGETQLLLTQYPLIKNVSIARTNLKKVKDMKTQILGIPEIVEELEQALQTPDVFEENVVPIHEEVLELQRRRDALLLEGKDDPEALPFLESQTLDVARITGLLQNQLVRCIQKTLELAVSKPNTLAEVLSVIETEERLDSESMDKTSPLYKKRKLRGYRGMMLERLKDTVSLRFADKFTVMATGRPMSDISDIVTAADFIMEDIELINDEVTGIFPPMYDIMTFFSREYHLGLHQSLQAAAAVNSGPPSDVLDLVTWIRSYETQMNRLGISKEILQPELMVTINPLILRYLNVARENMLQWVNQILKNDVDQKPAEIGRLYYSLSSVDLFESVSQQIELVRSCDHGDFLLGIARQCIAAMKAYQEAIVSRLESDGQTLPFKYLCSQINSGNKMTQMAEEFITNVSSSFENSDLGLVLEECDIESGFRDLAISGVNAMCGVIYSELQPSIDQIYGKAWIEGDDIGDAMLETLSAYFGKIEPHVEEYFFRKLVDKALIWILGQYIRRLFTTKISPTDGSTVAAQLMLDMHNIEEFFGGVFQPTAIKKRTELFIPLQNMITAEPESVCIYYSELIKKGLVNLTPEHVDSLLTRLKSFDKKGVKEAVNACKALITQTDLSQYKAGPFVKFL